MNSCCSDQTVEQDLMAGATSEPQSDVDLNFTAKLYTALRKLRTALVNEAADGIKPYHVFGNTTLQQISTKVPRTKEELLEINGVSEAKVSRYGDRVLETVEATLLEFYKGDLTSSGSNDSSEDDNCIETTMCTKKRVVENQNKSAENLSAKLYSALKMLRTDLVKEAGEGVMPYHIFGNSTLQQMSKKIPRTKEELLEINGIGEAKVSRYGDRVLETVGATIRDFYKGDQTSRRSKDSADSIKRRRETENVTNGDSTDDDIIETTVRTKKSVLKNLNKSSGVAEVRIQVSFKI